MWPGQLSTDVTAAGSNNQTPKVDLHVITATKVKKLSEVRESQVV